MAYQILPREKQNYFPHFSNLIHYIPDEYLGNPFDLTHQLLSPLYYSETKKMRTIVRQEKRLIEASEEEMAKEDYVPRTECVQISEQIPHFGKERCFFTNRNPLSQANIDSNT